VGHALRHRQYAHATTANGRSRGSVSGWPHLDVPPVGTGLIFHDGEPVRASDAVASINRWAARDAMGQMIKAIENELVAIDDRTFRWALKKPCPKIPLALGKTGTPCCFVMPARIAATDPFRQISEYVGSGPMRFVRNEWVPGAKAVFAKFADYMPRQEPASWLAGGKRMQVDRIEWIVIPDPATAAWHCRAARSIGWKSLYPTCCRSCGRIAIW
jgi:peptide/nickel transport system substrate-binding protein